MNVATAERQIKLVTIRMPRSLFRKLSIDAAERETTKSKVIRELVELHYANAGGAK